MKDKNDSKIKAFAELLKKEIEKAKLREIRIENNRLIYSFGKKREYNISSYNQTVLGELGRAYAVVKIAKEFQIPPDRIKVEEAASVGAPSKRLDIKIETNDIHGERKCIALVECKTSIHKISDVKFTNYFKRQLYNIAHSYVKDPQKPYPLTLIACEVIFQKGKVNFSYYWFLYDDIEKTVGTGQVSLDEIISRNSSIAHTKPPSERLYFSVERKRLKLKDLLEVRNQNELKKLLKEKLHQALRKYGVVENKAFETIIHLLMAKALDENRSVLNPERDLEFQVLPSDYGSPGNFYKRLKKLLEDAQVEFLHEDPKTATKKEILNHPNRGKILLEIVPYIQKIKLRSLRFIGEDSIGDVFLDFMHSIFRQSRGLFFTHPNIARFVCKAVGVEKVRDSLKHRDYKYILDPSCGSGTFLIEALRLIFKDYPFEKIKEEALKTLFGMDNNRMAATLSKVNMVIHGDGSANIYTRDALSPLANLPFSNINQNSIEKPIKGCTYETLKEGYGFDIIITNPPFSLEIKRGDYPHFRMNEFVPFKSNTTMASECFFIERWFQLLNPQGRIGAVLPVSILDSPTYLKARLLFLTYFKIIAIVGLPEHAFAPHAGQKTVLVFAQKRSLQESNSLFRNINKPIEQFLEPIKKEKIIFFEAEKIGYKRVKKQKSVITQPTLENDLSDNLANFIASAFEEKKKRKNRRFKVLTLEEILNRRGLNLSPIFPDKVATSSSKKKFTLEKEWEIVEIEKGKDIDISENLFLCETGDIVAGGAGVITPKNLALTTTSNKERIVKKIKNGKFGYLKEGDVIIAPVRVYQKKIAVVTKTATQFLYSKDFIVLRRKGEVNILSSFALFHSLRQDENIEILKELSSTGKSGYPKIKDKQALLKHTLYKFTLSKEKLKKIANIYDEIYKEIFLPLQKGKEER